MTLQKWRSNNPEALKAIPSHLKDTQTYILTISDPSDLGKALGVHWDTQHDQLYLSIPELEDSQPTKRLLASGVARLYDVPGWFGPVTLYLKIILRLWQSKLDWDNPIPPDITSQWQEWKDQLPLLSSRLLQRCYFSSSSPIRTLQLHGFSDASMQG